MIEQQMVRRTPLVKYHIDALLRSLPYIEVEFKPCLINIRMVTLLRVVHSHRPMHLHLSSYRRVIPPS